MIAAQALRVAGPGPGDVRPGGGNHSLENGIALGDLGELVDGVVAAVAAVFRRQHLHAHQPVRIFIDERVQDNGVDDAIHGGAAADSERQRTECDSCEGAVGGERARPEAEILHPMLEPGE